MARALVTVGDLHCGSIYGLCPPDLELAFGQKISLTPRQQWLWSAWHRMIEDVQKRCPEGFDLVVMGDSVEGLHHRSTEVISAELEDHVNAALTALEPICSLAGLHWHLEGTDCHVGRLEHVIASKLGGEPSPHGAAWETLHITYAGTQVYGAHHLSSTKRAYLEASGLGIEFNDTILRAAREGYPIPRVGIYAHRHVPSYFGSASGVAVVNGAWQFLTRYGRKYVPGAITTPSVTILDWTQEEDGADPNVIQLRYTPPPTKYA